MEETFAFINWKLIIKSFFDKILFLKLKVKIHYLHEVIAQLAGVIEYIDCISAKR